MTISFLVDPSLLQVAAGRDWVRRASGRLDLCTPTLSGRTNESELLPPFLPDRNWYRPEFGWHQAEAVDWIRPMPGTEPHVPIASIDDLIERCRVTVSEGRVLVARRPAVIDGLLARGHAIDVRGQPTFDASLRRLILELGEDAASLVYALFRPRRCRYMLLGPAMSHLLRGSGGSVSELVLLDRGPLWGHGRLVTQRSIADHPPPARNRTNRSA